MIPLRHTLTLLFAATLVSVLPPLGLATGAAAQERVLKAEHAGSTLLQLDRDAGFLVQGTAGTGAIPATGAGVRLMWHPGRAAFRVGRARGTEWNQASVGLGSAALGDGTTASGLHAIALGERTVASGDHATAYGNRTTASAINSTAMGQASVASGGISTAFGVETGATEFGATAMGFRSKARGLFSTAIGDSAIATGDGATAVGVLARAGGSSSMAYGYRTRAGGDYSTAAGTTSQADGKASVAMGFESRAGIDHGMGLGAVAIGYRASAYADHSVVLGRGTVLGREAGSFVSGGSLGVGPNSFSVHAQRLWLGATESVPNPIGGRFLNTSTGAYLSTGGVWSNASDIALKEGFRDEDPDAVLERLAVLPVRSWSYRAEGAEVRHVGPTAQDFRAAFGLGHSDVAIGTVDITGVSVLAVQALERRTSALREAHEELKVGAEAAASSAERIARLETENAAVRAELEARRARHLDRLERLRAAERSLEGRRP